MSLQETAKEIFVEEEYIEGEVEPSAKKVKRDEIIDILFGRDHKVHKKQSLHTELQHYHCDNEINIEGML